MESSASLPGAIGTGITSATLNVIGGVGGPPVGLYAANAGWDPPESRASLQAFFLVQGIATVAVVGLTWPDPWMVLALVIGTLAGMWLAPRIPEHAARLAVLGVAAFGGVAPSWATCELGDQSLTRGSQGVRSARSPLARIPPEDFAWAHASPPVARASHVARVHLDHRGGRTPSVHRAGDGLDGRERWDPQPLH